MNILVGLFIILGLSVFEIVSSLDNAIINAEVLSKIGKKGRQWFLWWGLLLSVFVVRGLVPWLIIWMMLPSLGPLGALTASFSSDPRIHDAVEKASPILLVGGGTFLLFLFLHWLFLERKTYGLKGERFFYEQEVWFYAIVSLVLAGLVWFSLRSNPMMAFGAVLGSTVFFIIHGFSQSAEKKEQEVVGGEKLSDMSRLLYLMVIDATFSMDGVLGAFAFTLSVPLILIGNGIGALVIRQLTVGNIARIGQYVHLKNGAMYSMLILALIMLGDSFGLHIPSFISPLLTLFIIGYFFSSATKK